MLLTCICEFQLFAKTTCAAPHAMANRRRARQAAERAVAAVAKMAADDKMAADEAVGVGRQ